MPSTPLTGTTQTRITRSMGCTLSAFKMETTPVDRDTDVFWMRRAFSLAHKAQDEGEVPVGAVLVKDDKVIGEGWNRPITLIDPTAHAEILALRDAARLSGNYRLPATTLYVTLEPCPMCVGALLHARVKRVVFGAYDPKTGAAGSVFSLIQSNRHHHSIECFGGVLHRECADILRNFFKYRRTSISSNDS
jgi:tRNA(adenine34) deaminase